MTTSAARLNLCLLRVVLCGLVQVQKPSRGTIQNTRQNLFFAFISNPFGGLLAARVLSPVFGMLLSPMLPSATVALSAASILSNALRLRKLEL